MLNPPQKPVMIRYLKKPLSEIFPFNKIIVSARIKEASMFEINVPHGKPDDRNFSE